MIRVLFFAGLREKLGCAELELNAGSCETLADLRQRLRQRGEDWRNALGDPSLQMARNRQVAADTAAIASGDEIAFFPPVTGG